MKALGSHHLPISASQSLQDLEVDKPTPDGRDLLVAVTAVAVNGEAIEILAAQL